MQFFQIPLQNPPLVAWIGVGQLRQFPLERYLLPDLWCIHLFGDPITLRAGDESFAIKRGDATLIPPATPIEFLFPSPAPHWHIYAHFRLVEAKSGEHPATIPAHQALARFECACALLGEVTSAQPVPPARAQAHLWSVLWEMARPREKQPDPLVARAQAIIEERMAQALTVAGLARELGVSHNHLTRSFRAQTGQTVVGFVREARLSRARHLLRHSTLPVKAIAAQVGLGDIHSLGKALRRSEGQGPRAFRAGFASDRGF